mgnify:CR=1 FL=1
MSAPRVLLLLLILWTAVFPVGVVAGWVVPDWVNQTFSLSFEAWMLSALLAGVVLMGWMLIHCIKSKRLSRADKNRWCGFLVIGGPITAGAYLWSELSSSSARS